MKLNITPGVAVASQPEDFLAYAIGYFELVISHHDSLESRIREQTNTVNAAQATVVGRLQRQLHVQAAVVESATAIVDELALCDRARGEGLDEAHLNSHRLQLLDEIRGLADLSVPA